jgi:hypothetical protein
MKSYSKTLLLLLLCLTTAAAFSQNTNKPKVFSDFPEVVVCSATQFSNAFAAREGETVTFTFSNNLTITGKVITNVQKYANLQSMTIQSPAFANAIFHLSKQINADRSTAFVGRILSTEAADGYEIRQDAAGNYSFQKIEEARVRQLCSL